MGNKQNIEKLAASYYACCGSRVPGYQEVCGFFGAAKSANDIDEDCGFNQFVSLFLKAHNYIVYKNNETGVV